MSAEAKIGVLNEINALAAANLEAYQEGDEALQAAKTETDALIGLLAGASSAITTSGTQAEQDHASVLSATAHTQQAQSLFARLEFSNQAADAKTAEKQLIEAARLLGKITRGYVHLRHQLRDDTGREIEKHRQAIMHHVFGGIGFGRVTIRYEGRDSQQAIIDASNAYKERLIEEQKVVTTGQQLLEEANTMIAPVEQEATTATEANPTAESIMNELNSILTTLGPLGPVLAQFPQRLEMLRQMHDQAGSILTSWTTAPEEVREKYRSIGATLANLTLPVSAEALNEHIGHITNSKREIELAKNEVEIAQDMTNWGREYLGKAIKYLRQYLGRRR